MGLFLRWDYFERWDYFKR